jgi:stage V sporulation protein D (sporulation-specific penicillin-binding protein)
MKKIVGLSGGVVREYGDVLVRQTISQDVSDLLREYMYQVVEGGTGTKGKIAGYRIGGKTGTAEKQPREENGRLVSFLSFVPVDDPQVMLYVVIDEPSVPREQVSAALAVNMSREIYEEALPYLGIFPQALEEADPEGEEPDRESAQGKSQNEGGSPAEGEPEPVSQEPEEPTVLAQDEMAPQDSNIQPGAE